MTKGGKTVGNYLNCIIRGAIRPMLAGSGIKHQLHAMYTLCWAVFSMFVARETCRPVK